MQSLKSLILGGAGQDGVLLASLLQSKGYEIHAVVRKGSNVESLSSLAGEAVIHEGDATDRDLMTSLVTSIQPTEIYNLAAKSSVGGSWKHPELTIDANLFSILNLLEVVRSATTPEYGPRLYQASSSEMFGQAVESPQRESTQFRPLSPYAVSKAAAHFLAQTYREAYGMFVSCGILYNHESRLRPASFVTRKITKAAAQIKSGKQNSLQLGTLDVSRDWGYAGDYVEAMWLMLQQDNPDDYIVATGKSRSLREFVETAFAAAGVEDWEDRVSVDPALSRPTEVSRLVGDAAKAEVQLGWIPGTSFAKMIQGMVEHDLELVSQR